MSNLNQVYAQLKTLAPEQLAQVAQRPEHGVASLLAAARLQEAQQMNGVQPPQQGSVVQRLLAGMQNRPQLPPQAAPQGMPQLPPQAAPQAQAQMPAQPAPMQRFAGGGSVGDVLSQDVPSWMLGPLPMAAEQYRKNPDMQRILRAMQPEFMRRTRAAGGEADDALTSVDPMGNYTGIVKQPPRGGPTAMLATPPTVTPPAVNSPTEMIPPEQQPPMSETEALLRQAARGGAGGVPKIGYNPPSFSGLMPTRRDPKQFSVDAMPTNEELAALMREYGQPDAKRMAELEQARKAAGIATLAQQVMKGRGLGGSFGPAAGAAVQAMGVEDEKRREYEDRRKAVSDQLRLKVGEEKRSNTMAGREEQRRLSEQDYNDKIADLQFKYKINRDQAEDMFRGAQVQLENAKLQIYAAANSLEAKLKLAELKATKGIDPKVIIEQSLKMLERDPTMKPDVAFNHVMGMYERGYGGIAGLRRGAPAQPGMSKDNPISLK